MSNYKKIDFLFIFINTNHMSNTNWLLPEDILYIIFGKYSNLETLISWYKTCKTLKSKIQSQIDYLYYYKQKPISVEEYYTRIRNIITLFLNSQIRNIDDLPEHPLFKQILSFQWNNNCIALSEVIHCNINYGNLRGYVRPYLVLSMRNLDGHRITISLANDKLCYLSGLYPHIEFEYGGITYFIYSVRIIHNMTLTHYDHVNCPNNSEIMIAYAKKVLDYFK